MAAIERAGKIVDEVRTVTVFLEVEGDALTGGFAHDGVIGIFAHAEEIRVHAGEHFEFAIGGAAAHHGHIEAAAGPFFLQASEGGHGLLGGFYAHQPVGIHERFQLQENDVGPQRALRFGRGFQRVRQRVRGLGRIVLRFLHAQIRERIQETVGKAIVLVGFDHVFKFRVQPAGFAAEEDAQRRQKGEQRHAGHAVFGGHARLFFRAHKERRHQRHQYERAREQ